MHETLTRWVTRATGWLGSFTAIGLSFFVVGLWFLGGLFVKGHFGNDTYQLLINTGTTIVTFWMVFIIQNTQNRDGRAVETKLDAILKRLDANLSDPDARDLMGIEDLPEDEIKKVQDEIHRTEI